MNRRWLFVALALFAGAAFVRAFPAHPAGLPMAVAANLLIAGPCLFALWRWRGGRSAAGLALVLAAYAYGIETVAVRTGLPYGAFRYGAGLGPLLFGAVPLLLPLAYIPLVLGAVAVVGRSGPAGAPAPIWCQALVGALVLVGFDLVMDPGALRLGYWRYASGGAYYGVPVSNFVGWLLTGAVVIAIVAWWTAHDRAHAVAGPPPPGLATSACLMLAFWTGVAVWHGLVIPAVLGAGAMAGLWHLGLAWPQDPRARPRP